MHRYLAIVWNPHGMESAQTGRSVRANLTSVQVEWIVVYDAPGMLILHKGSRQRSTEAYVLKSNGGVILGKIFDRHDSQYAAPRKVEFNERETLKIVSTGGQHLVEHYWGSYVAFLHDELLNKHHILRDPMGNLPCYHTRHKGIDIFFSSVEDSIRLLPLTLSVDRDYLVKWLVFSGLSTRHTGLENLEDLPGGECLTLSQGSAKRTILWDPISFARTPRFEQPDEAARELRLVVQNTVSAWASCYQNIVLHLSGGLDSSIVAACLAQAPSTPQVTYINFSDVEFDREPLCMPGVDEKTANRMRSLISYGDERYFARLVAARWHAPLVEKQRSISINMARLWHVPLKARPALYCGTMDADDAEVKLIEACGAQAFFSGQSGDSLFLAAQHSLSAVDHACLHGITPGLWQHLVAASKLSGESLWAISRRVIEYAIRDRSSISLATALKKPTLLREELVKNLTNEDIRSHVAQLIRHSSLPPGKRNHVTGLAGQYHSVNRSTENADHIHPLNSQPIWELMLQIPTYTILTGGIGRGLARRAFADALPAEIRTRQSKGTGTPFAQQLIRRNLDFVRRHLLDGLLVQQNYLDRQRLRDYFSADEPFLVVGAHQILNYFAAEIWLQQWTNTQQSVGAQSAVI